MTEEHLKKCLLFGLTLEDLGIVTSQDGKARLIYGGNGRKTRPPNIPISRPADSHARQNRIGSGQ